MCHDVHPRNNIRIIKVWLVTLSTTRQLQTVQVGLTKDKVLGGIRKTEAICLENCGQTIAGCLLHLHESHQLRQFTSRRVPLFFCSKEANVTIIEVNFPPPSTPYAN